MNMREYAVYDDTDNYLFGGTSQECADYLGITEKSLRIQEIRHRKNYHKPSKYTVIRLEDEDEIR